LLRVTGEAERFDLPDVGAEPAVFAGAVLVVAVAGGRCTGRRGRPAGEMMTWMERATAT
jgi:hypothetical protein